MSDKKFIIDGVEVRYDSDGAFDELCCEKTDVHFEMMDDKTLWIGLSFPGRKEEVHVTVSAAGRLSVSAHPA